MKKISFTALAMSVLGVGSCPAQFIPESYETVGCCQLVQIDYKDSGTQLFFEFTAPSDSEWPSAGAFPGVSEKTCISIPGHYKKYKLLSAVNIPIDSEAERKMVQLDHPGQKHRFVLEFEKLPATDCLFDLVGESDKTTLLNFKNVAFNISKQVPVLNVDDFVADYPLKEYGRYYVDGVTVTYVKHDDLVVNAVTNMQNPNEKCVTVALNVQNHRNNSILFSPANIVVKGYSHPKKRNGKSKQPRYYDDDIYGSADSNAFNRPEYDTAISIPIDVELLSCEDYGQIVRNRKISGTGVGVENDEAIPYVRIHTLPADSEYSGFFAMKSNKKLQSLTFTLTIGGESYTFSF